MPTKRELEDTAGGRFWEIWEDGGTVYTRTGKIGSAGQTKLKATDDPAAEIAKQVEKKLLEGFLEKGGGPAAPALDGKELARHLKNLSGLDSHDPAVLVLADWLQTQNHPWGELIALQHNAATTPKKAASLTKQADKHLQLHRGAILGELAAAHRFEAEWHDGFLKKVTIGVGSEAKAITAALKALFTLPAGKLVEGVVIDPAPWEFPVWRDWGVSHRYIGDPFSDLEKVTKSIPARVKHVGFGAWPAKAAAGYARMPTFTAISKAVPEVTTLELTGTAAEKPGKLTLPSLVDLRVHFANADGATLTALAGTKAPKLERLEVWLGGESSVVVDDVHPPDEWEEDQEPGSRYPKTFSDDDLDAMEMHSIDPTATADDVRDFLGGKWPATLKHLSIGAPDLSEDIVTVIAKHALVKQLETLKLGGLTEASAAALVTAKKSLAHLTKLEISGSLTPATIKKVKAAVPATTAAGEDLDADRFLFRFVATVE